MAVRTTVRIFLNSAYLLGYYLLPVGNIQIALTQLNAETWEQHFNNKVDQWTNLSLRKKKVM